MDIRVEGQELSLPKPALEQQLKPSLQVKRKHRHRWRKFWAEFNLNLLLKSFFKPKREFILDEEGQTEVNDSICEQEYLENHIFKDLIQGVSALDQNDVNFVKILAPEVRAPYSKLMRYVFPPLVFYDLMKVRQNVESLRRLKVAAEAYRRYRGTLSLLLQQILRRKQIIKEAFFRTACFACRNGSSSEIRSSLINSLRNYAGVSEADFMNGDINREAMVEDLSYDLLADSETADHNREYIAEKTSQQLVRQQVFKRLDAIRYSNRFAAVEFFANNLEQFNLFINSTKT